MIIMLYKAVDFFCGGGGMTYGLREAGIDVVGGIDIDKEAKATYEYNNPGSKFILRDITELPEDYLEKNFAIEKADDNLIFVGCSPCQYYSIIRSSKMKSKKSKDLLLQFKRFIEYYNPGYILVENVPGIVTNKDSVLPAFLHFLTQKKYIVQYKIVNMKDYGIPQNRKRFSLIATRLKKDIDLPPKTPVSVKVQDVLGIQNGFYTINAGYKDPSDFFHSAAALTHVNMQRLKKTPKNGGTRLFWKDIPELQLKCYIGKDNCFHDVYGRLHWNKPCPTITTKFYSISNGRFAHPEENRGLSIREGATLQSFPKSYVFKTKNITIAARLIGNAVPPEYARQLGEVIIKSKEV